MRFLLSCALIAVAAASAVAAAATGDLGPPTRRLVTAPAATAPTVRHLTQTAAKGTTDTNAADIKYGRPPSHRPPSGHFVLGWPLKGWEWALYAISAIGSFLAAGAGMGAGMFYMPAFTRLANFKFATAAALSSTCITTSNLVLVALGMRTKHPLRPQSPAVDWDVVLLLSGPLLVGAMVGSFFSIVLPQVITQALQACLLFPTSWLLIKKARTAWHADSERLAAQKEAAAAKKTDAAAPLAPRSTSLIVNPLTSAMSSIVTTCSLEVEPAAAAASRRASAHFGEIARRASRVEPTPLGRRRDTGPLPRRGSAMGSNALPPTLEDAETGSEVPSLKGMASPWVALAGGLPDAPADAAAAAPATGLRQRRSSVVSALGHRRSTGITGAMMARPTLDALAAVDSWATRLDAVHPVRGGGDDDDDDEAALAIVAPDALVADPDAVRDMDATFVEALSTAGEAAALRARKSSTAAVDELDALRADVQAVQTSDAQVLPLVPVLLAVALALSLTATRVGAAFARCGSVAYWLVTVAFVPVAVAGWVVARSRALAKLGVVARAAPHAAALGLPDTFFAGRVAFTPRNTISLPAFSAVAGVLAGMLGIGGGIVMNPICLALGMHPRSTIASCQVGLVINTIGAVVTYAASGFLPPSYAVSLGILAALTSGAGIFASDAITRKTGRPSFIVVTIAAIIFVALLVAIALSIVNVVEVATGVTPFAIGAFCHRA